VDKLLIEGRPTEADLCRVLSSILHTSESETRIPEKVSDFTQVEVKEIAKFVDEKRQQVNPKLDSLAMMLERNLRELRETKKRHERDEGDQGRIETDMGFGENEYAAIADGVMNMMLKA